MNLYRNSPDIFPCIIKSDCYPDAPPPPSATHALVIQNKSSETWKTPIICEQQQLLFCIRAGFEPLCLIVFVRLRLMKELWLNGDAWALCCCHGDVEAGLSSCRKCNTCRKRCVGVGCTAPGCVCVPLRTSQRDAGCCRGYLECGCLHNSPVTKPDRDIRCFPRQV